MRTQLVGLKRIHCRKIARSGDTGNIDVVLRIHSNTQPLIQSAAAERRRESEHRVNDERLGFIVIGDFKSHLHPRMQDIIAGNHFPRAGDFLMHNRFVLANGFCSEPSNKSPSASKLILSAPANSRVMLFGLRRVEPPDRIPAFAGCRSKSNPLPDTHRDI